MAQRQGLQLVSATGAVTGRAGRGAAAGAAGGFTGGFMWGLFNAKKVDPVQKNFVEKCLRLKRLQSDWVEISRLTVKEERGQPTNPSIAILEV